MTRLRSVSINSIVIYLSINPQNYIVQIRKIGAGRVNLHIHQAQHIRMGAVAHDFNLTVYSEAVSDILEDILYFLDGVLLLVLRIVNRNDNSITSLT